MVKAFVSTCVLAALAYGLSAPAAAYTFDRRTLFTFNQPIALPGVTLPAGTYTFRLADPTTGGRVVQVLNDSGTQSYAMLLSMPATRQDIPEESEISFMETSAGMPAAVKIWWQEGSRSGYELIYTKEQSSRLARGIPSAPVATEARSSSFADSEIASRSTSSDVAEPDAEETADAAGAVQGPARQDQLAQPAPLLAQESTPLPADQGTREQLPRTASFMPLAIALGTLMLFGGGWLARKARTRA